MPDDDHAKRRAVEAEKRYEVYFDRFQEDAKNAREGSGEVFENCALKTTKGDLLLTDCFEGKPDLIVIHNMGIECSYCTMWADGINGVQHHLRDRAGLVLVSPDPPETVEAFANERGWKMPVASAEGTGFTPAVGFGEDDGVWPGMSTFHRDEKGVIRHIASECFGEYDVYTPVWHMVSRLKDGENGWGPKNDYSDG